jgi:DNA-binding CsgD family transcriptional regulator
MHGREAARQAAGERLRLRRSRGGLEMVPGDYWPARGGPRLVDHNPQETPATLVPVRDGSVPRIQLLWAAAILLLEAIADDVPDDPALVSEIAGLLADVKRSAPPSTEPPWPDEPLTESETRVLRYLPTYMGAPEIAAELGLSPNTVKTHQRHLYRKLGAHSRRPGLEGSLEVFLLAHGRASRGVALLVVVPYPKCSKAADTVLPGWKA